MMFIPWWKKEIVAGSDIPMTTAGSHSLLLRQCHDLENPHGPAPVVGPLPVHERTAVQIIVAQCDGAQDTR